MALDKLVDSTQLDSDLTSVANAIRTKGGTSAQLAFPAGFAQAVADLPSGGREVVLLASGVYVKTDGVTNVASIPVSFVGTPTQIGAYVPEPISGAEQSIGWIEQIQIEPPLDSIFLDHVEVGRYQASNGSQGYVLSSNRIRLEENNTILRLILLSTTRVIRDNTYNWYIWGYAE